MLKSKLIVVFLLLGAVTTQAQELFIGGDAVNRYVWRGSMFENSPTLQPYVMDQKSGFEAGAMGSYSINQDFQEISLYLQYGFTGDFAHVTLGLADYYYEEGLGNFFDFSNYEDEASVGSHFLEGYATIDLVDQPLSLLFSTSFYNDPDYSMYTELRYAPNWFEDYTVGLVAGAALGQSREWYFTEETALTNIGVEFGHLIQITDSFSLPVGVDMILNPNAEAFHMVFRMSI